MTPTATPEDRLAGLIGTWTVHRVLYQRGGGWVRFRGHARWQADGAGLRCAEVGQMSQGDTVFEARRDTQWHVLGTGIDVRFGDGRAFHWIGPGARVACAHDCPPDDYRLRYDFTLWPRWSMRWQVSGPRKDYVALTRYAPQDA